MTSNSERRVSVVGMPKVGKTSLLGGLWLACSSRANSDKNFYARIEEKTSGIREVPNRMREGYFPSPTLQDQVYEADFIMKWRGRLGYTTFRLPFLDIAGEDWAGIISAFMAGNLKIDQHTKHVAWQLYEYVLMSQGFIFIAPCDLAVASTTPDLEVTRLLESINDYKEWAHQPKMQGFALVFTKYDLVNAELKGEGIDLAHPNESLRLENTDRFMKKYLPDTYSAINFYNIDHTIYLPSWFELEYNEGEVVTNSDGSPRIRIDSRTRMPYFSMYYYNHLINWLRSTITG